MNQYEITQEELQRWCDQQGLPTYRSEQLWRGLVLERSPIAAITSLPVAIRTQFSLDYPLALSEAKKQVSRDGTIKWLYSAAGNVEIETVLMPSERRASVCVSSQAGCAMGCVFCATGQAGFDRHLSTGEMVEQVLRAAHALPQPVTHIVLMGMGEPLANYDNVLSFLHRMCTDFRFAARHITVSTVGIVPRMEQLGKEAPPVTLAVSLHAATDEARSKLIPLNRRYAIADIVEAARAFSMVRGRRVTFEYTVIDGVNNFPSDAAALGSLLAAFPGAGGAHLNLIPLNPTAAYTAAPMDLAAARSFAHSLATHGIRATVRRPRGRDIAAACGQLRADQPVPMVSRDLR